MLAAATSAVSVIGCDTSSGAQSPGSGGQSAGGTSAGGATAGGTNASAGGASSGAGGMTASVEGMIDVDFSQVGCTNPTALTPCGGDVVGTWNVVSSCLEVSGDMDVSITSLGCTTVPVTGSIQTSGTFVANADGSYIDNTLTTSSITFPLDPSCLAVSSVAVGCDRLSSIFEALGWKKEATCTDTNGQCNCSLSAEQQGGLGAVLPYTDRTGQYTVDGTTLTVAPATYSYCVSGDTLTVSPQASAVTGPIVLQREGTTAMGGAGGASGASGMGDAGGVEGPGNPGTVAPRPCDIYQAGGTPCAAAHSTVRALFSAYAGPLYQVRRADGMFQDIPVSSPGGLANSAVQDTFCAGTSCTIWRLYDQTGNGNFLEAQTPQSSVGGFQAQTAANATAESLTVGGNRVYSLFTRPYQAYWNDGSANGMPLGDDPQSIYMVTSGTHYNGACCYNYGNGQRDRVYMQAIRMSAVYFGSSTQWSRGAGEGPWVMADMENGMLANNTQNGTNLDSPSLNFPYVTAMMKEDGSTRFALKGGDATQPTLTTMWNSTFPTIRMPMRKEGAITLGAGGDCCLNNGNLSEGTFYEGAIVAGYASDETDNAIHASIVEAGYGQ